MVEANQGQFMDGADKFSDTKLGHATANVASDVFGHQNGKQKNQSTNAFNGTERVIQNQNGYGEGPVLQGVPHDNEIVCGPLINYKGMGKNERGMPTWRGSVLLVTKSSPTTPQLRLQYNGPMEREAQARPPTAPEAHGGFDTRSRAAVRNSEEHVELGVGLYADAKSVFFRFTIDLPLQDHEAQWEYSITNLGLSTDASMKSPSRVFVVPAAAQSMRIMFHSCNGFSVGTDEDAWSGPALWNDVLRVHETKPFHVMIGGGDQIYNDGVRVQGPLRQWTDISNPVKRRDYPFGKDLRAKCDEFYFDNYIRWFSTGSFADANGRIPQLNIWDDHDIIDGFGSYTDHFMRCPVFRGIGGVAFKYYCLFQHHIPPPVSTFTTDAPQTTNDQGTTGAGADPMESEDTFVLEEQVEDPSWIIGAHPGPYVEECSRSMYMRLGARIAFVGIDARTERTRKQVNYPDTYDIIFDRLRSELSTTKSIKHLILLLGIPIAYPRLIWLENILTSPLVGPVRFLSKRFGIAGGFFNKFDGQIDLLDDLDDHYTARHHKKERKELVLRLQQLAEEFSVRVTILGGDVHLGALGRFYSKPQLEIPVDQDHRYMANIISSAITNHPPPGVVANLIARRNKIHHLDHDTDETLVDLFDKDPGNSVKTGARNHCTMPSRNYAILTEHVSSTDGEASLPHHIANGHINGDFATPTSPPSPSKTSGRSNKTGNSFLGPGEEGAGTKHAAASGIFGGVIAGGLDVCLRVEIDQHDAEGHTEGYGFSIPALRVAGANVDTGV